VVGNTQLLAWARREVPGEERLEVIAREANA